MVVIVLRSDKFTQGPHQFTAAILVNLLAIFANEDRHIFVQRVLKMADVEELDRSSTQPIDTERMSGLPVDALIPSGPRRIWRRSCFHARLEPMNISNRSGLDPGEYLGEVNSHNLGMPSIY